MRLGTLALLVTLGAPAAVWAQGHPVPERSWLVPGFERMPGDGWQRDTLPKRHTLPKIGLPLPPIGLQPPVDPDQPERRHRRARYSPSPVLVFVVPQYAVGVPVATPVPAASQVDPSEQAPAKGTLVLRVKPDNADVFVDGYYIGSAVDLNGDRGGAFLDAGPHRIDLSAPGHGAATFDVNIAPNQAIVLRRELTQSYTPPPAPPVARTPMTFYLIPGCYAGNVPPKDAGLAPTCDITRAIVIQN